MLDRIYIQGDQLSIHLVYHGGNRLGWRGFRWRGVGGFVWSDSKKYLSELESVLNEIKIKQNDNNNKKNF